MAIFHGKGVQTAKTGALRIVIKQGTKDGPAIGHDPVTVELYSQSKAIHTYKMQIADGGVVEIRDLPLDVPFQPVVTVEHAGCRQEMVGPPINKYQPAVEFDMKVYEATTEKPVWVSGIRHIIAVPVLTDGVVSLKVTEMMGCFNPGDRAWAGENNVTLSLPLPPNAQQVVLGQGLAEANPTITNAAITRGKSMLPGLTEYDFGYTVPVSKGAADLSFTLTADTKLFALYLPDQFHVDKCVGVVTSGNSNQTGLQGRQLLVGKGLKAGQVVSVSLSGIEAPPPPPVATTQPVEDHTTLSLPRPGATTKP